MDVDVQWDYQRYPVKSRKASLKDFYSTMFGGVKKPLCKHVDIKGCEDAVAVTSWSYTLDNDLYDSRGDKRTLSFRGKVRVLLPEWLNGHQAHSKDKGAVDNFLSATKTHERGHGMACESLASAVRNFVEAMPQRVPPASVDSINLAFRTMVHEFYEKCARRADRLFDEPYSKHGGKWKAELDETTERDPDDLDLKSFMPALPHTHVHLGDGSDNHSDNDSEGNSDNGSDNGNMLPSGRVSILKR